MVNLNELSDKSLKEAIAYVPEKSVIVFEDIDAMEVGNSRNNDSKSKEKTLFEKKYFKDDKENDKEGIAQRLFGVSLSGLLNVLDGFNAPSGVIFVMTTNHIDKLDKALLRPGRIDYKLHLAQATIEQKMKLYLKFFPEVSSTCARNAVNHRPVEETMAEFQGYLLNLERSE